MITSFVVACALVYTLRSFIFLVLRNNQTKNHVIRPPSPELSSSSEDLSTCSDDSDATGSSFSFCSCASSASDASEEDEQDNSSQRSSDEGVEVGTDADLEESEDDEWYENELNKLRRFGLRPPAWSSEAPWCELQSSNDLKSTLQQLQTILTEHLKRDNYNSLGNLLHFYNEFR